MTVYNVQKIHVFLQCRATSPPLLCTRSQVAFASMGVLQLTVPWWVWGWK